MTLVVDASVAVKWVLNEEGSDRASALRDQTGLVAPSLIASEIGNALWKAERRGDISRDDAIAAMRSILGPFDTLAPNETLHMRALELAVDLQHPIYDCFYLALAERENATLLTADARLMAAATKAKIQARRL